MSEVYDAGVPTCPNCGQVDEVRGVPAVYRGGIDRVAVRVPANGEQPAHTEQRTVTSALAKALAPAPTAQFGWGCLGVPLLLAGIGCYIAAIGAGHWRHPVFVPPPCGGSVGCGAVEAPPPDYLPHGSYGGLAWLAVVLFASGATLLVTAVRLSRGFRRRLVRGRRPAEAVWSRGWYCGRCGTVHFRPAADVPSGAVQLGEFRRIVWTAGGYGHLAAKYPVV
ncbi:hypothetical protein ABH931_002979 [Streptacidiphilus sp. MAP12-33]|uniref:hypothetical protein n=1 Tax=Streptacidiphilus sp. MAP12-33 TaxID=3156266 RepID=UPI0035145EC9